MKTPLVLRYFIWSMLIFAISMILLSTRALRPLELKSVDFTLTRRYDPHPKTTKEIEVPVLVLPIYEQISQELFLGVVKDAIHRLKKNGAKVVIIPLPEFMRLSPNLIRSVQEIARDSIAIFAVPGLTTREPYASDNRPEDKKRWWVDHPLRHRADIPWAVMTDASQNFGLLMRFVPTGYRDSDNGEPVPDVAVMALKRFFDIPDKAEIPTSSSRIQIGTNTFPIERDGLSYVKYRISNRRWVEVYATFASGTDSLAYYSAWAKDTKDMKTLDTAWQSHKGKIVIIDWVGAGGYRFPSDAWVYAQILNSFFTRSFLRVHNEWNVLLITTLVILFSVLSYTIRNGLMVFISLVLAAAAVGVSVWLFSSYDILFEPVYSVVPILLCGVILPIVKVSGEKRLAEEKAKSLEEENRRLTSLLRPPSPGSRP
jgi:hypothetical protein